LAEEEGCEKEFKQYCIFEFKGKSIEGKPFLTLWSSILLRAVI